ncbi:hypothetical protein GARC_5112 [Paraglaciecola arctica BSs20135]|uniref:Uncharacterized protein n=1 Tax=Paraglaciecola arctica BSs20135 TaxID=493475 RepID=K6YV45_9ALTE|nr:hypothetical protein GARC_5112 [Paraglaciecola arctica BSs20135]
MYFSQTAAALTFKGVCLLFFTEIGYLLIKSKIGVILMPQR